MNRTSPLTIHGLQRETGGSSGDHSGWLASQRSRARFT
jgi:hypothetical protein